MSEHAAETKTETNAGALSSVKIEMNSRGYAQVKVSCYDGVDAGEMERLQQLALATYDDVVTQLGKRAAAANLA